MVTLDRRRLLDAFSRDIRHPVSAADLVRLLQLDRRHKPRLLQLLQELTRAGDLVRIKGGRYGLPKKLNLVVGELRCSPKGYGFVARERGGGPDVFVRVPGMGGALHGDTVVARIEHHKPDGRLEGSVIRVLKRANSRMLGRFERGPAYAYVVPLEPKILADVLIPPDQALGAAEGQIVEVELIEYPGATREATGRVLNLVGWPSDPAIDLELTLRRHDLPRAFPTEVRRAARAVPEAPSPAEIARRTDFRGGVVVTIDGEKARDFDDAVAATPLGDGGFRLEVHIADVSHYVRPGTPLDDEARSRGTSVYFPDHVIPMLPEELSNGICSLNPEVDRLVLSLVMEIDREGQVTDHRFHQGVIRSAARLTYGEVHRILVDRDPELRARRRALVGALEAMGDLARLLAHKRRERGSLDFDLPESEIVMSVAGEMTGIRRGERLFSHNLIEEFMILANETVAGHFITQDLPFVYRVHEPPDPPDVEELNRTLGFFGYQVQALSPKSFRELLEKVKGRPEERLVNSAALRTLKLARYQTGNIGHFGLASTAYSHFTSPIRRYPDLIVHRLLREWLLGAAPAAGGREERRTELDQVSVDCSRLERRAEEAEREYVERKKARFMGERVGQRFWGVIASVAAFGFFVELEEYFVEGLVHLTSLADDYYIQDEARHRLVGENTGRTFRVGDRVEVEVSHVDLLRRQVDFLVVASAASSEPAGADSAARPGPRGPVRGPRPRRGGR